MHCIPPARQARGGHAKYELGMANAIDYASGDISPQMEQDPMARKSTKTKEQIMEILAEMKAGAKLADLLAKHGVSASTLYNWKSRFGGGQGDAPRRRGRPPKNAPKVAGRKPAKPAPRAAAPAPARPSEVDRLKVMLVDLMLERDELKARLARR